MRQKRVKPSSDLRPIGARLLKSVGDTLRPHLLDAYVLELFAGQGRFSEMCLNEGATQTTLVEKDSKLIGDLKNRFPLPHSVVRADVFEYLKKTSASFDIVFADPPFRIWDLEVFNQLCLAVATHLKPGAIFLVKSPTRVVVFPEPEGFTYFKKTEVGESRLLYLTYGEEN